MWRDRAKCRDGDNTLFFDPNREAEAKAFCVGCPVMADCLSAARANNEPGVWGGTTEEERKRRRQASRGWTKGRPMTAHEERCLKALNGAEQREEARRLFVSGVTQSSMARALGITQSGISKWLRKQEKADG